MNLAGYVNEIATSVLAPPLVTRYNGIVHPLPIALNFLRKCPQVQPDAAPRDIAQLFFSCRNVASLETNKPSLWLLSLYTVWLFLGFRVMESAGKCGTNRHQMYLCIFEITT